MPVAEMAEHFKNFSVGRQIAADLAIPPPVTPLGSTEKGGPEASHPPPSTPHLAAMAVCIMTFILMQIKGLMQS